jgi:phosphate transport system substrate-binding protein
MRLADCSDSFLKFIWLMTCVSFLFAGTSARTAAQSAEEISGVKRIAIDWPEGGKGSTGVRDRLEQKLKGSGKIQFVKDAGDVDAVLHGSAVMWTTGYISTSPRSRGLEQATYRGYATAELNGKNGKTLWSYLVTPRRAGWKSISEDLGDQLASALLEAVVQGKTGEKTTVATELGGGTGSTTAIKLNGAGATFPAPIYQKWFESFAQSRPEIQVKYDAVGSEEGLCRVRSGDADFGTSDMPLSAAQLNEAKLKQFATVLGAVVPIYNVKGAPDGLNLTPEVLAGIFLGKIRSWNAPEIRSINRHVHLPDEQILVVHRSDGSGTTYAWTEYLSKVSAEWKSQVGPGSTVSWPVGVGAERNQGVADTVFKTANSIGYVEFIYALQHELNFGAVRNGSGEYVKADLDSVTAAGKSMDSSAGKESKTSITNAGGKHTYPIASFTWILIPAESKDAKKQGALWELVHWMLTSGQKECQSLGYAPLPGDLAARELQALGTGK